MPIVFVAVIMLLDSSYFLPLINTTIGNIILMTISKNTYSITTLLTTFLFIISLSVLYSVHYLVIYYLLQPFNKNMQPKKFSYSIATLVTYILTYSISDIILPSEVLSVFGVLIVIVYIIISLLLVYKIAPKTFKLY